MTAVPTTTTITTMTQIIPANGGVVIEATLYPPIVSADFVIAENSPPMAGRVIAVGRGVPWLSVGETVAFRPYEATQFAPNRVLVDQRAILAQLPGVCPNGCDGIHTGCTSCPVR